MYMVPYTILGYMHFSSADADIIDKLKKMWHSLEPLKNMFKFILRNRKINF